MTNTSNEIVSINLEKKPTGLGFNIVGGTDSNHIAGDDGIFVSKLRQEGAAFVDGRLQLGDRILSVNERDLRAVTHKQAVQAFRDVGAEARLRVEPRAERRLVERPVAPSSNGVAVSSAVVRLSRVEPRGDPVDTPASMSAAPSELSLLADDVPRTPQRPPAGGRRDGRPLSDAAYVLVGLAAIGAVGFVAYRWYQRRA